MSDHLNACFMVDSMAVLEIDLKITSLSWSCHVIHL